MHVRVSVKGGFTLVEIMIAIAVMGALTAVAVPNYMRIRLEVNQEMVENRMKAIADELLEYFNQNRRFPPGSRMSQDADESDGYSFASHLSSIENKDAEVTYEVGEPPTTFRLFTEMHAGEFDFEVQSGPWVRSIPKIPGPVDQDLPFDEEAGPAQVQSPTGTSFICPPELNCGIMSEGIAHGFDHLSRVVWIGRCDADEHYTHYGHSH